MTKRARPITPQKIHAVFRKAGFARSTWYKGLSASGCASRSVGYEVSRTSDGLRVGHHMYLGLSPSTEYREEETNRWIEKYRAALEAAGVACEVVPRVPCGTEILVREPKVAST